MGVVVKFPAKHCAQLIEIYEDIGGVWVAHIGNQKIKRPSYESAVAFAEGVRFVTKFQIQDWTQPDSLEGAQ